jgi:hypothetical protein
MIESEVLYTLSDNSLDSQTPGNSTVACSLRKTQQYLTSLTWFVCFILYLNQGAVQTSSEYHLGT